MEPSRPHVHGQPPGRPRHLTGSELRLAAAAAAALLLVTSSGDVVLVVVLLAAAGAEMKAGLVAALAAWAWALRWGATSLAAISGAQAVLGPAGLVGPATGTASAWCGAGALILAAAPSWAAPVFGLAAAYGVAGPSLAGAGTVAVRTAGAVLGVGLAVACARLVAPGHARAAALALGTAAVALAALS